MNPRSFLNFFHTRTGKLLLFAGLLAAGLVVYHQTRGTSPETATTVQPRPLELESKTNKPQVVETVQRGMEVFRPPPPKPESKFLPEPIARVVEPIISKPPPPPPPLPISLFGDSNSSEPEPKSLGSDYAPYGRLIPCETVITVDSSSIRTPIIGFVTEDIYHAGRLIIPAGTEVHGTAAADRVRERLASGNSWTLVWHTGEEMRLSALALDREFEADQSGWGITDGSAGLRGRLIKSDNLAQIKLFAATFLSGAASALTEKEHTILGSVDQRSLNNAPFLGAEKVLSVYAQRIYDSIERDGFYVRIPSGKQFYLYVLQTIDRADAWAGGTVISQTGAPGQSSNLPRSEQ